MMRTDRYGNPITAAQPETVAAYETYSDGFLSYRRTLPRIIEAADTDLDCCTAQAHAAAVHMAFEAASGFRKAAPYLARAQALAPRASERERAFVGAVSAWARQDFPETARLFRDIAERWPRDVTAAKWGQYHHFNLGDQDGLLAIAECTVTALRGEPYVHGMHAFALEQAHRIDEAEAASHVAVELQPGDAWAHHALAHVMETRGRVWEGLKWMKAFSDSWSDKGFFIRLHNWWHVALFHLDMDNHAAALRVFDKHLIDLYPEFCQEQIGAISMLWRLEMRGVRVGKRWDKVLERVRAREAEHILPFHDLHYVYALARAGEAGEAEDFLASMTARVEQMPDSWSWVWRAVALPMAQGLIAAGQGRHGDAARHMHAPQERLFLIGGSHAQRDVFEQAYITSLIKAGKGRDAAPLVRARYKARPHVPISGRLLAAVS